MGILTDYFAATPAEAAACREHGPLPTELPKVAAKWLEPTILLGQLWAAVDGVKYKVNKHHGDDEMLEPADEEGPWIIRIREECRAAIAGIPDERVPALAATWSEAEEWMAPEPDWLEKLIPELRAVARAAVEDRAMYVWICL
ncbi:hypothetical protein HDA40_001434 [Hamadaea flava]|uniref:DUF1877 family protein n=1 Tax=Hamadaea flava TaxID=1742688 RepID=A0ABV8LNF5_9ACTN|nr:hypothetical protein [Hamadaea flava]MCP2322927.1 hypothetical protein [Hamadaea flava]